MSKNVSAKSGKRRRDRRVGRTRAQLGQALRKLMEERPLEKITVQQVIALAGVSRSAFYDHYDDKADLLLSDMDEFLDRMAMLLVAVNEPSNRVAPVREFFAHVAEATQIRGALARSDCLQDFFDLAVEHFARGIEARLNQMSAAKGLPARDRFLLAHALAGAFIALLNGWLRKSRPPSPEAMDDLFHQLTWTGLAGVQARQ
jgi:AcrR family transcriptional regulator